MHFNDQWSLETFTGLNNTLNFGKLVTLKISPMENKLISLIVLI